jgi:hypothetical protein
MDAQSRFGHKQGMAVIDLDTFDRVLRLNAIGEMAMAALVAARSGAAPSIRRGTTLLLACVIGYLVKSVDSAPGILAGVERMFPQSVDPMVDHDHAPRPRTRARAGTTMGCTSPGGTAGWVQNIPVTMTISRPW